MPIWVQITVGFAAAMMIVGMVWFSVRSRRDRTRSLRERDIPPFLLWKKLHYPKANEAEAVVIERVLATLSEAFAGVEPTQLLPDDPLENFVLDRRPKYRGFAPDDDWSLLLGELAISAPRELPDLASWEVVADNCWETVGDVIDFMIKRLRSPDDQPLAAAKK